MEGDAFWKKSSSIPHLLDNESKQYEYFRWSQSTFYHLLVKVWEKFKREYTFWRLSLAPKNVRVNCKFVDIIFQFFSLWSTFLHSNRTVPEPFEFLLKVYRCSFLLLSVSAPKKQTKLNWHGWPSVRSYRAPPVTHCTSTQNCNAKYHNGKLSK